MPTILSTSELFCCSIGNGGGDNRSLCTWCQQQQTDDDARRQQQQQQQRRRHKRMLANLSHEERLKLVSLHNILGYKCIVLGSMLLISMLVLAPMVSWESMNDPKIVLLAGLVGVGIGSSIVLIVAESPRQFEQARKIQSIDQDLLETMTTGTEDDDSDDRFQVVSDNSDVSNITDELNDEQV